MKRLGFIFFAAMSMSALGQSQFIGIKGGVSWTNVNSDNIFKGSDPRMGFSAGLSYERFLKKRFYLSAEVNYSQRGFSVKTYFVDALGKPLGEQSYNYNYDYLSLPIKTAFNFGKNIYGFADIGIIPALLVNAKTIAPVINGNGTRTGTETYDATRQVSKFDLGGMVEAGAGYKFNKFLFFTAVTYNQSITTITNSNYFSNSKIRHYGLTLALGLKYRITKA
jgi:hypothetical protein